MKKILLLIMFVAALTACSNDSEMDTVLDKSIVETGETAEMLSFTDKVQFMSAVEALEKGESVTRVAKRFNSLYDEYKAAWEVEEEYYASLEKYNEFKKMFPHLYFPEYEDDYSFFLPVSNESVAKLVNQDGNVMIDGKVVNCIDIKTPQDLLNLGMLYPGDDVVTRGLVEDPALQNKVYMNSIPKIYNQDHDRRMWVDTTKGDKGGVPATFVIIHFSKKGAFGRWKRYSSRVTLTGTLKYDSGAKTIFPVTATKEDYGNVEFEALEPLKPGMARTECGGKNLTIEYRGIEGKFHLDVNTRLLN